VFICCLARRDDADTASAGDGMGMSYDPGGLDTA